MIDHAIIYTIDTAVFLSIQYLRKQPTTMVLIRESQKKKKHAILYNVVIITVEYR